MDVAIIAVAKWKFFTVAKIPFSSANIHAIETSVIM